jgi:hypothetical protein
MYDMNEKSVEEKPKADKAEKAMNVMVSFAIAVLVISSFIGGYVVCNVSWQREIGRVEAESENVLLKSQIEKSNVIANANNKIAEAYRDGVIEGQRQKSAQIHQLCLKEPTKQVTYECKNG